MKLTREQFDTLLDGHIQRVIDNMDMKVLMQVVYDSIKESFLDGSGNLDKFSESSLICDIMNHEGGDSDSAYEFMVGAGIPDDVADALIQEEMS